MCLVVINKRKKKKLFFFSTERKEVMEDPFLSKQFLIFGINIIIKRDVFMSK